MNKRNENKLTSYEGILSLLEDNSAKVQSVAGFSDTVTEFSGVVAGIKAKSIEVESVASGKTSSKYNAEDALVECLLPVCSALYLFGRKQNDPKITVRALTTETKLRYLRDTELASFGNAIAEMAAVNSQGIAGFGISAEKTADLKARAEAYSASIGARESSIADRKGARESLNSLFAKADELLNEEIDHFMEILRPTETEFYNKYFAGRIIKDTGVRHRQNNEAPADAAPAGAGIK